MIVKQFYLNCLAHASYMIGDNKTSTAVVVDPQRDVEQYLQEARRHEWKIRYVFLTHFHADFLAGHLELQRQTGAEICLGAKAQTDFPIRTFQDGEVLEFGSVRIQVLETPGHTPESISLAVYDLSRSADHPHCVLTGDTLFIGDVGRPDLMASVGVTAEELGEQLFDSLRNKLMRFPDETLIYPAHGAGSMCGKNLSNETVSTLGKQRWENYALQPMTKEEFVGLVTADQPEAPSYFGYDAKMNREKHPVLDDVLQKSLTPLSLETVLDYQKNVAQVLDVRNAVDYAGGHLKESLNIGLVGKFATWAGTVLAPKCPIVIIAEPGYEREAIQRLGRIGFDRVVGYLSGGMQALMERPDLVQKVQRIGAQALAELLTTTHPPMVVDVRSEKEWESGHIDQSINIPLPHLAEQIHKIPLDGPVVVHCASGYRSSTAIGILEKAGRSQAMDLIGGYDAWLTTWGHHGQKLQSTCTTSCSR
ncbi:MAG: MBL fold metallo-hydrolase [Nitrospirota bacterium]|nr:MBL fold metallo-hydrolase [Nitrospirota bacterium]MDH5699781.1 MBL fold metallo-hydrolase [Nitrospirota bacterium]